MESLPRPADPHSTLTRGKVDRLLDRRKRVLVAGELILDEYIWGHVSRISPEAPVPVVEVIRETCHAGGAANVARNLREFLTDVHMLGLAGTDAAAGRLHELLVAHGIHLECVQVDPAYTTICKTRVVARHQQLVRIDRETPTPLSPPQRERALRQFSALLPEIDAVILEDYAKGLLDQALADAIIPLARAAGKIVAVDPKPANTVVWHDVTCITPNRHEAFLAAGVPWSQPHEPPLEDSALLEVGARLLEHWRCLYLLITLSEQGMMLFEKRGAPMHIPTRAQQVFDVSGAGDTAIALFTAALAGGATAYEAAEISNHASGLVVGKLGTATVTREELLAELPGMSAAAGRRAVFLDRDGTLMKEVDYCHDPERVEILPGVREGLARLRVAGWRLVIVTNQSGLGRGYFTLEEYEAVHARCLELLGPGRIEAAYMCPDHPDRPTERRKPAPGMLLEAARDLGLDLAASYMIGDRATDVECGRRAGAQPILVKTGYGLGESAAGAVFLAEDFAAAVGFILRG